MTSQIDATLIAQLNAPPASGRLGALASLIALHPVAPANGGTGRDVNNHIHTTYSFSPYSPAKAVWMARQAGLATAGIMDHDSVGGAREFIEAGRVARLPVTIGAEVRVSLAGTPFAGRRLNNPDQDGVAYAALHGIPHNRLDAVGEFLKPIRAARDARNRAMTRRLDALLRGAGLQACRSGGLQPPDEAMPRTFLEGGDGSARFAQQAGATRRSSANSLSLDFDTDVVPLSLWREGGAITERHILCAVAKKLLAQFGDGAALVAFLRDALGMEVGAKIESLLLDPANPHIEYDLLGAMKGALVERFHIPATDECPGIRDIAAFANANGIILAYAYLGDVTDSVTGDKRARQFEDSFLDELFASLVALGFHAVTYMPSRNTRAQLERVMALCEKRGLFQISGEDINQSRQQFVCEAMRDPFFAKLHDAAWALIGHEKLAAASLDGGMFSARTVSAMPALDRRVVFFRDAARATASPCIPGAGADTSGIVPRTLPGGSGDPRSG